MMNYTFTNEDIKLVEKFIDIKNRGFYCDGKQLTDVYNRVLHKSVNPTNCGSCIKARINELEQALNHFKAIQSDCESVPEAQPSTMKEGENKAVKRAKNGAKTK